MNQSGGSVLPFHDACYREQLEQELPERIAPEIELELLVCGPYSDLDAPVPHRATAIQELCSTVFPVRAMVRPGVTQCKSCGKKINAKEVHVAAVTQYNPNKRRQLRMHYACFPKQYAWEYQVLQADKQRTPKLAGLGARPTKQRKTSMLTELGLV